MPKIVSRAKIAAITPNPGRRPEVFERALESLSSKAIKVHNAIFGLDIATPGSEITATGTCESVPLPPSEAVLAMNVGKEITKRERVVSLAGDGAAFELGVLERLGRPMRSAPNAALARGGTDVIAENTGEGGTVKPITMAAPLFLNADPHNVGSFRASGAPRMATGTRPDRVTSKRVDEVHRLRSFLAALCDAWVFLLRAERDIRQGYFGA